MKLVSATVAALFFLVLPAPGQSRGSYTLFGMGCPGSGQGPNYGLVLNDGGGQLAQPSLPNEYAFAVVAPVPLSVVGFELFTRTTGATSFKMQCCLYRQNPVSAQREPLGQPVATGTMVVGAKPDFHRVTLNQPVAVKQGEFFWISQKESAQVLSSDLTEGTLPPGPTWWRNSGVGAWGTTGYLQYPSWRIICPGPGATVHLGITGHPTLGKKFSLDLRHAFGSTVAFLFTGTSKSAIGGVPLPFDLGFLGAPGCRLYVNDTIFTPAPVLPDGTARVDFLVPPLPVLKGARFHNQFIVSDPKANTLQLVFTNGGEGMVGG